MAYKISRALAPVADHRRARGELMGATPANPDLSVVLAANAVPLDDATLRDVSRSLYALVGVTQLPDDNPTLAQQVTAYRAGMAYRDVAASIFAYHKPGAPLPTDATVDAAVKTALRAHGIRVSGGGGGGFMDYINNMSTMEKVLWGGGLYYFLAKR